MKTLFIPFLLLIFGSVSLIAQDLDSDFDGYSDAAEATAGTNPQSGLSFLTFSEIEIDEANGVAIPKWESQNGVIYQVEVSQDLETWSSVLFAEAVNSASIDLDDHNLVPTMAEPSAQLFVRLNARSSPFDAPVLGQTWAINRSYVPGNSDRHFGPIGHRPAVFKGEVGNVYGTATSPGNFRYWIFLEGPTVMPTEGIEASFGECMIHVLSGDLEGSYYPIKSSWGMTFEIELGSLNVENEAPGLAIGNQIAIVPQWTLETQVGGVPNETKVYPLDRVGNGVNNAPDQSYTYYFSNSEWDGWYDAGARSNRAFAMDEVYLLRNDSSAACIQTSVGEVAGIGISHRLLKSEQAGVEEDQWITHTGALPLTLAELGGLAQNGDSVYFHDPSATGFNNAPPTMLTYYGTEYGWYDGANPVDASYMVTPGSSFLLRRLAANNTGDRLWSYESGHEKPMVSVAVTQSQGMEVTQEPIVFEVSSGGGHLEEVAFHYHLLGSFDNNEGSSDPSDYTVTDVNGNPLDGMVMVPPNGSTEIYVHPVADIIHEYPEVVEIRLLMHADYDINSSKALARGTITDAPNEPEYEKIYIGRYAPEAIVPEGGVPITASGTATLILNGSNTEARVSTSFEGLTSNQTVAHIHHASESGGSGPVIEEVPYGNFSNYLWTIKKSGAYSVTDIIDSLTSQNGSFLYMNVHTSNYQAGEIWGRFARLNGAIEVTPSEIADYQTPDPIEPLTDVELQRDVARFLTQATFGPSTFRIHDLQKSIEEEHGGDRIAGYAAWIADQMSKDQTSADQLAWHIDDWELDQLRRARPDQASTIQRTGSPNGTIGYNSPDSALWTIFVHGHDQLRQRIALALSEIFVVSRANEGLQVRPYAMTNYWDELARFAGGKAQHGNYRDLLEYISKSPVMGHYLTHLKNKKAVTVGESTVSPDENYAREIMQLFSIGLLDLHENGVVKLDHNYLPTQTYGNEDIENLARVFTGWSYSRYSAAINLNSAENTVFHRSAQHPFVFRDAQYNNPMRCFDGVNTTENFHDSDAKTFLGQTIGPEPDGQKDLTNALDVIAAHPNVAPFMAKLLIKRFVTSNPSPGYVYRVANVFNGGTNYGSGEGLVNADGEKGDFLKVVTAILLDPEARNVDLSDPVTLARYGKAKEPMLYQAQLLRAMTVRKGYATHNGNVPYTAYISDLGNLTSTVENNNGVFPTTDYPADQIDNFPQYAGFLIAHRSTALGQAPLGAPSVFNFFLPDYSPAGDLTAAGLTAPELQLVDESSIVQKYNLINAMVNGFNSFYLLRSEM